MELNVIQPMPAATLEALKGSIAKWEGIVSGKCGDGGHLDCPLCEKFFNLGYCTECPVMARTGREQCKRTPYSIWNRLHDKNPADVVFADTPEKAEAARAELDFLRSLLPKDQ